MKTLEQIRQGFIDSKDKVDTINRKIVVREQQIHRLVALKNKLENANNWTGLITPILDLVRDKYPRIIWDDNKDLTPMGLRCAVGVFGKIDGEVVASLVFTPSNILSYDTGEYKTKHAKYSIGDLNGFNNISKPVEVIDDIYWYVYKQLRELNIK
jgi:hypothetical protein